jgi:hypothetical protein
MGGMTLDDFQRMIVASGLVDETEAAAVRSELNCHSLQAFGDLFVAKQFITPWQCRQLLEGYYKGFFVDDEFKLLEYVCCVGDRNRYLAESTIFRERVILTSVLRLYRACNRGSFIPRL